MSLSLILRGGLVVDGTGAPARQADVGIDGDRVSVVGVVPADVDADEIDITGLVVSPGFINVLSHSWDTIQVEPGGPSDLFQGVTTQIYGEGVSLGPCSPELEHLIDAEGRIPGTRTDFRRLSDGLNHLETQGCVFNVASFVGGHNLRALAGGLSDAAVTATQLDRVRGILDEEMSDGALGIGTALIYPPGCFADTAELVALAEIVGRHNGLYISHLRSEADHFLEALDELVQIGVRAQVRTEVYHLKVCGRSNWPKMLTAIETIQRARDAGQAVSANMYPYTAGATGLVACIPPRYHADGPEALRARLDDPGERAQIKQAMRDGSDWENLYRASGGGSGIMLLADLPDGTPVRGRRLDELANDLGRSELDLILDVCRDRLEMLAAYFNVDEGNLRLGLRQPWVSICSDSPALAAGPPWTAESTHPRGYGAFARVLGTYCRRLGLFGLPEAVRRMTSLPAESLQLRDRGILRPGAFADLAVFDPVAVSDTATYEAPHSYATGMRHVLVNGVFALRDANLTEALPGRRIRRNT